MIKAQDFQTALVDLVEKNLPYEASFEFYEEPTKSYVWISVRAKKESWDTVYFQRILEVELQVIIVPDEYGNVKHTELWDALDKLDEAIMPTLQIGDRFITVQSFNSYIVDEILHYEFELDFTDYIASAEYEGTAYDFMKELNLDLGGKENGE